MGFPPLALPPHHHFLEIGGLMAHASRPPLSSEALEVLDRHWAVAAMPAADRARAIRIAEARWSAIDQAKRGRGRPPKVEDDGGGASADAAIHDLATAYEIAALDALQDFFSDRVDLVSGRRRAQVETGAARAFTLYRVLPLPEDDRAARVLRVVRVAALAVVGRYRGDLERWLDAEQDQLRLAAGPGDSWEEVLRGGVAGAWVELLRPPSPEAAERAYEMLGALRESRTVHERRDPAAAKNPRLFPLLKLADAAVALTLDARRGPLSGTLAQVAGHLGEARTGTVGDVSLETLLRWLHAAAQVLTQQQTAQTELAGLTRT